MVSAAPNNGGEVVSAAPNNGGGFGVGLTK
ncbi:hypothetical protein L195_g019311, partial [Trifolium pratense]